MPLAGVLRVLETQLTMSFLFGRHGVYGRPILTSEPALGHIMSVSSKCVQKSGKRCPLVSEAECICLAWTNQGSVLEIWNVGIESNIQRLVDIILENQVKGLNTCSQMEVSLHLL